MQIRFDSAKIFDFASIFEQSGNSCCVTNKIVSNVIQISEFSLVDSDGNAVRIFGLLMNNGGTVCDDEFSTNSADAICRKMGYPGYWRWTSGVKWSIQSSLEITLNDVLCSSGEWSSCSFKSTNDCGHSEDVFLQCDGIGILRECFI